MLNLELAISLPQVEILEANATSLSDANEICDVRATFTNTGFLSTSLGMARRVKIVRPDWAEIKFLQDNLEIIEGGDTVAIGHLKSEEKRDVVWRIRANREGAKRLEISINSTPGGVRKKVLMIKE